MWESSNADVASVDSLGKITAVSEGSCTVKVTSAQNPEVFAEVEVTVTAAPQLTYFQGILVVNKTYALPADYSPGVQPEAQSAFDEMQADAAEQGLNIYISSGFRSYDYQAGLYSRYVERSGQAEADRYSARAGHSEHQTGLAFDLNTITDDFKDTAEGKWVRDNCFKYGFIIRYPADKESVTGYMYEPWHIRYLGKETAQEVYDSGLCLEEYLGITSEYTE
ncbi:MAG: D-alanyl-D-alanine carboxypeptidase family protein [Oscillospiraceae bacterium]|nr:D-alanyl-D-alanine carboxypeptidase family protein [Oscillospiraceae bacterium]